MQARQDQLQVVLFRAQSEQVRRVSDGYFDARLTSVPSSD